MTLIVILIFFILYTVKNCVTLDACISICPILNCSLCNHLTSTPALDPAHPAVAEGAREAEVPKSNRNNF